ncbi:gamma-glutamylcyclotransferase family protein [Alsobacter sp. KACC 23698]|uniref:Gamma-glutamylcyclotransferase family protein n=1 Tax=Alsobacter sp. KACC 23698 TaxID=3149229 RepID=A0AAU7J9M0_9HYPH
MPLYFAYGSNMDRAAMAQRCPGSRPVGLARLPRHRFLITVDGYASVARDPRRTVHGMLWDLALSDVPALDRYESLHTGLYAKISQPVVTQGGARRALVYVGRSARPGKPKPGYMEGVLAAARDAGLPAEYLYELEHGEPAPRRPGTPLFKAPI